MTSEHEPLLTIIQPDLVGYPEKLRKHQEQSKALYETAMLAIQTNGFYIVPPVSA